MQRKKKAGKWSIKQAKIRMHKILIGKRMSHEKLGQRKKVRW